jgi:hypothetical protein
VSLELDGEDAQRTCDKAGGPVRMPAGAAPQTVLCRRARRCVPRATGPASYFPHNTTQKEHMRRASLLLRFYMFYLHG